jgi:hypothetical protein
MQFKNKRSNTTGLQEEYGVIDDGARELKNVISIFTLAQMVSTACAFSGNTSSVATNAVNRLRVQVHRGLPWVSVFMCVAALGFFVIRLPIVFKVLRYLMFGITFLYNSFVTACYCSSTSY